MKKQRLIVIFGLLAGAGLCVYLAAAGQTAEKAKEEETTVDAAMRVDLAPLLLKIDKLQAEVTQLRTAAEGMNEKLLSMQDSVGKMEKAMDSLKKPDRWQYHFLYQSSNLAANRLAEDGWELVTSGKDNLLIFRKPAAAKEE